MTGGPTSRPFPRGHRSAFLESSFAGGCSQSNATLHWPSLSIQSFPVKGARMVPADRLFFLVSASAEDTLAVRSSKVLKLNS